QSSSEKSDSNKQVTIVWKRGQDATPAASKIVEEFEKKNPNIKVKIENLPSTSTEQHNVYTTALSTGDDSIDVVTMDVVWASEFSSAGWLLSLDKYFTEDQQKGFFPGNIASVKYKDSIYGVPFSTDAGVLFYRKDLVPTPPKTWDDLIKISKDNIGKNGINQGILFQAFQNEAIVCNASEFIFGNGGNIVDSKGKVVIDSPQAIGGVKIMKSLIDQNIAPKGVVTYKPQDCTDQFVQGKTLFMRNWPLNYTAVNKDGSAVKDKVGIAPMPMGPDGTEAGATLGGWNLGINKNSKHPEEAWKFIQFVTSDEGQKINAIEGSYMSTRESLYSDKDVLAKFPQYKDLLPILKVAKPRPVSPYYAKISDALQVNLHKAVTGEAPVDSTVKEAAKELNDIISNK
ncbi:MAG: ABC-type sugar transport system, periplasmic component, partial [Clostridiaceae bacterium]|nr:ABC-type sugar transport system, periplasmic component [Clostridiaceae bacterium]